MQKESKLLVKFYWDEGLVVIPEHYCFIGMTNSGSYNKDIEIRVNNHERYSYRIPNHVADRISDWLKEERKAYGKKVKESLPD